MTTPSPRRCQAQRVKARPPPPDLPSSPHPQTFLVAHNTMATPILYADVAEGANLDGQLFAGAKFWVAQRVPSRNHYQSLIRSNGGQIVALEKKADYVIADYLRKDCPAGSISYTFIDECIQKAEIADRRATSRDRQTGTVRDVGSRGRHMKGGRKPYSAEEDRILYQWVSQAGMKSTKSWKRRCVFCTHFGGYVLTHSVPSTSWQSWRDRYLKQLRHRPPAAFNIPDNTPPSPPLDQFAEQLPQSRPAPKKEQKPSAGSSSKTTTLTKEAVSTKATGLGKAKKRAEYTWTT